MTNRKRPALKRNPSKSSAEKRRSTSGLKTFSSQPPHATPGSPSKRCQLGSIISLFQPGVTYFLPSARSTATRIDSK